MFQHRLALRLGCTVRELLDRMDAREYLRWQLYEEYDPFGNERGDLQAALVASTVANQWRGEKDKAFQWAERAYTERDAGTTWLKIDFSFRGLRDDPRYKALLRKMNLPE